MEQLISGAPLIGPEHQIKNKGSSRRPYATVMRPAVRHFGLDRTYCAIPKVFVALTSVYLIMSAKNFKYPAMLSERVDIGIGKN